MNASETASPSIEAGRYAERSRTKHFANETVDAALRNAWSNAAAKLDERRAAALEPADSLSLRIGISSRGRIVFAHLSNILAVVAQGNYVVLQREAGSFRLRESISVMAEKLEAFRFVRIHRSVLVNRDWVEEIRPRATGDYLLRLKGGKEFTVTRTYKRNLRMLAELWLGNDSLFANAETG